VSSSDDKTIVVWESDSGRPLRVLKEHINWVWSVAFSPDGNVIASGSEDETVLLWNAHTGDCIRVLRGHGSMYSVAFHPHGSILASGSHDGNISLWNVQTGECLQTLRSDRPYEHMNITGVEGLPDSQKAMLKELGAIDNQP